MVYEGNEKYIFVSYAHKDAQTVIPIIEALSDNGYRVWYDSGIEAGTEWPEYIEEHLINSHVVLVFMSPNAIESRNCRNEINFALELKKEILVVYLEETTLLKGMHLQLNSTQSLYRMHHKSEETFLRELLKARVLSECNSRKVAPAPLPASRPEGVTPSYQAPAKQNKLPVFIMLGAILIALVVLICVIAFGGRDGAEKPPAGETTAAESTAGTSTPVEMSDDPFDYTVELEGVVYQLPCRYEELTARGWTIATSTCSDSTLIMGNDYETYAIANNGKKIYVTSYNMSGNAKPIKDCLIGGFDCEAGSNVSFKLAKGITPRSTVDQVLAAYGTPGYQNVQSDCTTLTYEQAGSDSSRIRFYVYTDADMAKYSSVSVMNRIETENDKTETNTQRPAYLDAYKAPGALGTDLTAPVVKVDGDLYQLPAPVSAFAANGWKIVQQPGFVKAGNVEYIRMERNGLKLDLSVCNFSTYQTTPENCAVYQIDMYAYENIDVELANGVKIGLTKDEVAGLITEEFAFDSFATTYMWSYFDFGDSERSVTIRVDAQTNKVESISVSCRTWNYE